MKRIFIALLLFLIFIIPVSAEIFHDISLTDKEIIVNSTLILKSKDKIDYWNLKINIPEGSEIIKLKDEIGVVKYNISDNEINFITNKKKANTRIVNLIFKKKLEEKYGFKIAKINLFGFKNDSTIITAPNVSYLFIPDAEIEYGETTDYGNSATSSTLTRDHLINLSDLATSTTYHYRVISTDANGNTSTSSDQTFTTLFLSVSIEDDNAPPTISNVTASTISDTQATITWTTNELSTSQILYGTTASYGSQTTEDTTLTYQHSVTISGLTKKTTYHYQVISKDAASNSASSQDNTFTTTDQPGIVETITQGGGGILIIEKKAKPDETPPTISGIGIKDITYSSVTISWQTNEATDGFVKYGETTDYGLIAGNPEESKTSHSVNLVSLIPGTTYHFRILSKDSYGNLGSSADKTFTTLGVEAAAPEKEAVPEAEKGLVEKAIDILTKLSSPHSVASVSEALEEKLMIALNSRNKIIHRVIIDNVEKLLNPESRKELIKEINTLRANVRLADKSIRTIINDLGKALDGFDTAEFENKIRSNFY